MEVWVICNVYATIGNKIVHEKLSRYRAENNIKIFKTTSII